MRRTLAKWLGTVEATQADAAIAEVAKQFAQPPGRLIAVQR
jgi:hypothetical protein